MNLSTVKNSFVLGIFDCCRAPFPTTTRGANADEDLEETASAFNFIFYYGCPPNKTVPGKSTLAKAFFQKLRDSADPYYGTIILPTAISHWHGTDGQANCISNSNIDLVLQFADWERPAGAKPLAAMQMFMEGPADGEEYEYDEKKYFLVDKIRNMFNNAGQTDLLLANRYQLVTDKDMKMAGVRSFNLHAIKNAGAVSRAISNYMERQK